MYGRRTPTNKELHLLLLLLTKEHLLSSTQIRYYIVDREVARITSPHDFTFPFLDSIDREAVWSDVIFGSRLHHQENVHSQLTSEPHVVCPLLPL